MEEKENRLNIAMKEADEQIEEEVDESQKLQQVNQSYEKINKFIKKSN